MSRYSIQILTFLIALLFLFPGLNDIGRGIRQGLALTETGSDNEGLKHTTSYAVSVEPNAYQAVLPESNPHPVYLIEMQTDGMICLPDTIRQPAWVQSGGLIFVISGLAAFIYLIIRVFVTVPSIAGSGLMNRKNIRRIRQMGIALAISSLCFYLSEAINVYFIRSTVSLRDYRIVYPSIPGELTVALIILLLTEVLKIGCRLQEEQALTI